MFSYREAILNDWLLCDWDRSGGGYRVSMAKFARATYSELDVRYVLMLWDILLRLFRGGNTSYEVCWNLFEPRTCSNCLQW